MKDHKFNYVDARYKRERVREINSGEQVTVPNLAIPFSKMASDISKGILKPGKYQGLFEEEDFNLEDIFDIKDINSMDPLDAIHLEKSIRSDLRRKVEDYKAGIALKKKEEKPSEEEMGQAAPVEPGVPVA